MHITLIMVQTLNGKITHGDNPNVHEWTSPEDQKHFTEMISSAQLLIMGRKTYEQAKDQMQHVPGRLRMILTSNPELFREQTIPNQLEFSNDSLDTLIQQLTQRGYTSALLLGGAHVNAAFFKKNLVDDIFLTIEPSIFGTGNPLLTESDIAVQLKLVENKQLNERGTLLLRYQVVK